MADQCEHTGPRGQCSRPKVDGSEYCGTHSNESDRIKGYQLSNPELREQFEHHSRSDLFSSLGQEIYLLRAMINERLNQIDNPAEMVSALNTVHKPLVDIVKCVETLSKLERQNNIVLGKEALNILNREIIDILVGELEAVPNFETIVDAVARRIAAAIANSRNSE